jgi:hypothetical protein
MGGRRASLAVDLKGHVRDEVPGARCAVLVDDFVVAQHPLHCSDPRTDPQALVKTVPANKLPTPEIAPVHEFGVGRDQVLESRL